MSWPFARELDAHQPPNRPFRDHPACKRPTDVQTPNMDRDQTHPNEAAFPPGLSGPTLRALANAGITSMDDLAEVSASDLGKLHGMGPAGVRILMAAFRP